MFSLRRTYSLLRKRDKAVDELDSIVEKRPRKYVYIDIYIYIYIGRLLHIAYKYGKINTSKFFYRLLFLT